MIVQVTVFLAPVVTNVDSAIHRINLNPVDKKPIAFNPPFEQLRPEQDCCWQ